MQSNVPSTAFSAISIPALEKARAAMADGLDVSARVFAALDAIGAKHCTVEHEAVCTVEEEAAVTHKLPGKHTKNFFLKDKTGRHGLFLLSVQHDRPINLTAVGHALKLGSKVNLRFAKDDLLLEKLGCRHGSVSPLALVNDAEACDVRVVLDKALVADGAEKVNYHPLVNTRTTAITAAELLAFCDSIKHSPTVLDMDSAAGSGSGGSGGGSGSGNGGGGARTKNQSSKAKRAEAAPKAPSSSTPAATAAPIALAIPASLTPDAAQLRVQAARREAMRIGIRAFRCRTFS